MKPTFATKPRLEPALLAGAMRTLDKGLRLGPTLVAYSGGKDGLCAALLAKKLGVNLGVCELSFTFAEQERDIRTTAALCGFEIIWRRHLDDAFLARHPQFVFAHDLMLRNALMQVRQRDSVEGWAREHDYKVVITGRKKWGNAVRFAIQERRNGTIGCHPLREWDDADVWTYLRDGGIRMPWIYTTEFGRERGNTGWPFWRQYPDRARNYELIYEMEPAILERAAAAGIVGARDFLLAATARRRAGAGADPCGGGSVPQGRAQ